MVWAMKGVRPLAAADEDLEADLACLVAVHPEADVMQGHGCAVAGRAGQGNLELAGQVGEFRVEDRVLAQQFGVDAGIGKLVPGPSGVVIGSDVAHAVTRGLDRGDLHFGQFLQDVRNVFQLDPVVLDVLARGEMAEVPIVGAGDVREFPKLPGREAAVGHVDPQHVGMQLHVEARSSAAAA